MIWSFYEVTTGVFDGRTFSALTSRLLELNTPEGYSPVEGTYDHLSQRVDVEAMDAIGGSPAPNPADFIIDYQPPPPEEGSPMLTRLAADSSYVWQENVENGRPRWVKRPEVVERERREADARRVIAAAEQEQARIVREALLKILPEGPERTRLQQLEDQIVAQREDLQ